MAKRKPFKVHAKALLACVPLFAFAIGFSWAGPWVILSCHRIDERVDCVIEKRLLGVIAFSTTTIRDLVSADVLFVAGTTSPSRTTDTYFIQLTDANDNITKIMAGSRAMDGATPVVKEITAFLADPTRQSYSNWTMFFVGYLAIVPGLVGMLFLSMVLWDIVATRLPGKSPT